MLSICLSLVITSLSPFTRKPFDYEGGSSHKLCSCIFSAKLPRWYNRRFPTHLLSIVERGSALGQELGGVREAAVFAPGPSLRVACDGRRWELCILRNMEALRVKVRRRQGAPCRGSGRPRAFPALVGRSFPVLLDRAMAGLPYIPYVSLQGAREESSVTWPLPTRPGGNMRREAGTVGQSPSSGDTRAVISPLRSAASSCPVGVATVTSVHREALTWSG